MKFMHISDLHLGKRLHEVSMLEDQKYILNEIQKIGQREGVDALLIAGDIYDKSIPPIAAVELFDEFLVQMWKHKIKVLMISGNHDSPERIAFGGRLMEQNGVYVSPVFQEVNEPVKLQDQEGDVYFYMLPFIKPAHVREVFPEEKVENYSDAVAVAIGHMDVDFSKRNVLITHQFVTGSVRSESEDISVGGTDNVNAEVFQGFDYVALGHIHRPQMAGSEIIRYCGTPLKYSFSEVDHKKSVTIVNMKEKGIFEIDTFPLVPIRDMHVIKGTFAMVTDEKIYEDYDKDAYVQVVLTDEEEIMDVMAKLRAAFPNIMRVEYDNTRTRENQKIEEVQRIEEKSPLELFQMLYEKQNNTSFKEEQIQYLERAIEKIWGGDL